MIRRIFREPLFQFFLLGIAIFLGYHFFGTRIGDETPGKIVITQGKIDNLITTFSRSWNRPPSQQELDNLLREYVREEVCVREAIALGMDRDDTVIRRRLRQKMEFLFEDVAAQTQPTEADLQAYLKVHLEKFQTETRFTFNQIYFNPERHSDLDAEITRLRKQKTIDTNSIGDSTLLEHTFDSISAQDVKSQFGEKFESKLETLPIGQWEGPIESGYGVHLVLITSRVNANLQPLNEIREEVHREWANAKRVEMNEKAYAEMIKRYSVTIEPMKQPQKQKNVAQVQH